MEWMKQHKVMAGGIVIVGVVVLYMFMGGGGGGSSASAGAPVADQSAVASGNALQMAQLQANTQIAGINAAAQVQSVHEANALDIAKIQGTLSSQQIAAQEHTVSTQADVSKSIATLQQGVALANITATTQQNVAAQATQQSQIKAWSDVTTTQNATMADLMKTNAQLTAAVTQSGQQAQVQIAQSRNSSWCFITTAAVETLGMRDDCRELQILRAYRDRVLPNLAGGKAALENYKSLGPAIVEKIAAWPDDVRKHLYFMAWQEYISPAVQAIERGQHFAAFAIYKAMVDGLLALEPSRIEKAAA